MDIRKISWLVMGEIYELYRVGTLIETYKKIYINISLYFEKIPIRKRLLQVIKQGIKEANDSLYKIKSLLWSLKLNIKISG
jgi:hypothetical protein